MRDLVATWRGEWPKTSMCPLVGYSNPSSSLTVVDLPEPFGPSRPNTSPRRTSKSTLSTARALGRPQKSLKTLVRPRTETTTSPPSRSEAAAEAEEMELVTGIMWANYSFGEFTTDYADCADRRWRTPAHPDSAVEFLMGASLALGWYDIVPWGLNPESRWHSDAHSPRRSTSAHGSTPPWAPARPWGWAAQRGRPRGPAPAGNARVPRLCARGGRC